MAVVILKGGLVEHEVPVTLDHEVDDFLVGLAGLHLLDHLVAKVDREFRVRFRNRLVLANEAPELLRDFDDALVRDRVEGRRFGFGGGDAPRGERRNGSHEAARENVLQTRHHSASSFSMRGFTSLFQLSSRIG